MAYGIRISTGMPGFDQVIDGLRLGDNVVWQVQVASDYAKMVTPYVRQALADGRRLIYLRFGKHPPLLAEGSAHRTVALDASAGFERFATTVHACIETEGPRAFYVFDCLTDLLDFWHSDLMIGNFFKVTCPFLFQLDTVAYFALLRGAHTYDTIARIRETTQLLLDVYAVDGDLYIHPLKVWERYSPTMFFPHLIRNGEATSVTASAQAARLFEAQEWGRRSQDPWERTLEYAADALARGDEAAQEEYKRLLLHGLLAREGRMAELCSRCFTLADLLAIAARQIGTGRIGGKSVGMLLARKMLELESGIKGCCHLEPHDSYYLGSDIFYTYIVQNGWWALRMRQKTPEGYFEQAPELKENLLRGQFPRGIQEQFMQMLEHFGQSPVIVRSSSLLEDNFGNAFAGKYESVFCANQGTPEDRYRAFEQAVRTVYASTMNPDALSYRLNRGLTDSDEQMAILVQRVSGDHYGPWYFPHLAGVGNSHSLYVWDPNMDPAAGMLRLVLGLGTRAVDRISGDYARLVALDRPTKAPPVSYGEEQAYLQHAADVLDLPENKLTELSLDQLSRQDLKADKSLFFSADEALRWRLEDMGRTVTQLPLIPDFQKLLGHTDFPQTARSILKTLERRYEHPVDIEFTANFLPDGSYSFNLLQCRPLQTRSVGPAVSLPTPRPEEVLFACTGNFMGGNALLRVDYVLFVRAEPYLALSPQDQYAVARLIGTLNQALKGETVLLMGPGRWGTSTSSLGVPVHFSEISRMTAVCEYACAEVTPDLSFGSHFFQDLVESNLFYAAIFGDRPGVVFRPDRILALENQLAQVAGSDALAQVVHLARTPSLTLYADVVSQRIVCCEDRE